MFTHGKRMPDSPVPLCKISFHPCGADVRRHGRETHGLRGPATMAQCDAIPNVCVRKCEPHPQRREIAFDGGPDSSYLFAKTMKTGEISAQCFARLFWWRSRCCMAGV